MDPLQILGYLKLPTKVLAGLALAAIGILFLPAAWIDAVGLSDIRTAYRWFLGLVILVSIALLAVEGIVAGFSVASRRAARHRAATEQRQVETIKLQAQERAEAQERERQSREETEKQAARLKFLEGMTDAERDQCRKFISNAKRTVWLNAEDGVVAELVRRSVVYCATGVTHYDARFEAMGADFTMNDWAWDYLHNHPALLGPRVLDGPKGRKGSRAPG